MMSEPTITPVTVPRNTVAFALPALHKPPGAGSDKEIEDPTQTDAGPAIVPASGRGLTVITELVATEPQLVVTV